MAELNLANIQKAQDIAKQTMLELNREITVGMSERDIIVLAQKKMVDKGSDEWWYHGLPGLVLLGKHSAVSVGSKDINHTDEYRVAGNDIITIDIAPTYHKGWGDYARTLFMENSRMCPLDQPEDPKHKEGLEAELHIHRYMVEHCDPDMTYEAVFEVLGAEIQKLGFRNLDFKGNLGHSIEIDQADRVYLEKGNRLTLRQVGKPFTLEPHILSGKHLPPDRCGGLGKLAAGAALRQRILLRKQEDRDMQILIQQGQDGRRTAIFCNQRRTLTLKSGVQMIEICCLTAKRRLNQLQRVIGACADGNGQNGRCIFRRGRLQRLRVVVCRSADQNGGGWRECFFTQHSAKAVFVFRKLQTGGKDERIRCGVKRCAEQFAAGNRHTIGQMSG